MAVEIERKFLVKGDFKKFAVSHESIKQAYISIDPKRSVRIRKKEEKAYITIKGESDSSGLSRIEWEREISVAEADQLFLLCIPNTIIDKTRYYVPANDALTFEVDEFLGKNEGLVVAEIELKRENQNICKPDWLGDEVTGDAKYYNSQLASFPYSKWKM